MIESNVLHKRFMAELEKCHNIPYYKDCNIRRYLDYKIQHEVLSWEDIITYINLDLDYPFYTKVSTIPDTNGLTVLVNKHNKLPEDYIPMDLEGINTNYSLSGLQLRQSARRAFEEMCKEAAYEGIYLTAISTFRSYEYQKKVYMNKRLPEMSMEAYQAERDKVSARAGHSEHQTGLAVDINDLEETFELTLEGKWLAINSYRYGFILRYPKGKEKITGYNYEPWHFRYVGNSLAKAVYASGLTYDEYYIRYNPLDNMQ